jgi:branched-chain amino acid transport system substrate-binding protein
LTSLILAIVCLAGAVPLASAQITIGVIAPLSGAVPSFGASVKNGIELAVRECNDRGGVLGSQINLIVEDGQCSAVPAAAAAAKLVLQDGVHYIVGEVCSSASIPVSDITNAHRVVQISPTSTNPAVTVDATGKTKPYIFRACFIDPYQGVAAARFAFDGLTVRRAFVMGDRSNNYVWGICESFVQEFQRLGGTIAGRAEYSSGSRDFSSILASIRQSRAELVVLPDYYNIVNLVTKQAKTAGMTIPFLGGDGWESSDLDTVAAAGSFYTTHFWAGDPRQKVRDFVAAYGNAYPRQGPADALAALGYDSVQLLLQAIQRAGSDDPERVRDALEEMSFHGVTGDLAFDASHNPQKSAVIMSVQEEGVRFQATVGP